MKRLVIFFTSLILIGHFLGSGFDLYNRLFWYDMPMHFLGGFWLAGVIVLIASLHPRFSPIKENSWLNIAVILSLVLSLGLAWEFFEMILGYFTTGLSCFFIGPKNRYVDTMLDLFFDGAGGLSAAWLIFKSKIYSS